MITHEEVAKGRGYPVGTVRNWRTGPHRKRADGTWEPVTPAVRVSSRKPKPNKQPNGKWKPVKTPSKPKPKAKSLLFDPRRVAELSLKPVDPDAHYDPAVGGEGNQDYASWPEIPIKALEKARKALGTTGKHFASPKNKVELALMTAVTLWTNGHVAAVRDPDNYDATKAAESIVDGAGRFFLPPGMPREAYEAAGPLLRRLAAASPKQEVYRGLVVKKAREVEAVDRLIEAAKAGYKPEFDVRGIASFTLTPAIANRFASISMAENHVQPQGGVWRRLVLTTEAPGVYVGDLSRYNAEAEVVCALDKVRVTGVSTKGDGIILQCEPVLEKGESMAGFQRILDRALNERLSRREDDADLNKAKGFPVGTVRKWGDGKSYKKQANGKWKPVIQPPKATLVNSVDRILSLIVKDDGSGWAGTVALYGADVVYEQDGVLMGLRVTPSAHVVRKPVQRLPLRVASGDPKKWVKDSLAPKGLLYNGRITPRAQALVKKLDSFAYPATVEELGRKHVTEAQRGIKHLDEAMTVGPTAMTDDDLSSLKVVNGRLMQTRTNFDGEADHYLVTGSRDVLLRVLSFMEKRSGAFQTKVILKGFKELDALDPDGLMEVAAATRRDHPDEMSPAELAFLAAATLWTNGHVAAVRDPSIFDPERARAVIGVSQFKVREPTQAIYSASRRTLQRLAQIEEVREPVFRGLRLPKDEYDRLVAAAKKGEQPEFDMRGLASFTLHVENATDFASYGAKPVGLFAPVDGSSVPVVLTSRKPLKGFDVRDFSIHDEGEVVTALETVKVVVAAPPRTVSDAPTLLIFDPVKYAPVSKAKMQFPGIQRALDEAFDQPLHKPKPKPTLSKGKKFPPGTVRQWQDGKQYIKRANGDWEPVHPGARKPAVPRTTKHEGTRKDGTKYTSYRRSPEQVAEALRRKNERVAHLEKRLLTVQRKMKVDGPTNQSALCLWVMQDTGMRVGGGKDGHGKTKGKRTYGTTTLLKRHVRITPEGQVVMTYPGKGGKRQSHKVTDTALNALLKMRHASTAKANDPLFPDATRRTVSAYVKQFDARYVPKDLRSAVARRTARSKIDALKKRRPQDPKRAVHLIAAHVSKKLGNTERVALRDYLGPAFIEAALKELGYDD